MPMLKSVRCLVFGGCIAVSLAIAAPQKADNTRQNKDNIPTADQQKESTADRDLAKQIRKSVVADKSLSSYAHNVKIIVQNGSVTLKGPVRSEDEKRAVEAKVKEAAPSAAIQNELTVAPPKSH